MCDKLPVFTEFFLSQGANTYEIKEIGTAVRNHSEGFDLSPDHPFYKTTALLKDADALDRIRLGENNLDPTFLRLKATAKFIPFAIELFRNSDHRKIALFSDMISIAESITDVTSEQP